MEFTRYFSSLIKARGVPQLKVSQYQKIFNIMTLEMRIDETNKLLKYTKNAQTKVQLNKRNYSLYAKKHNLLRGKSPEALIKEFMSYE